MAAATENPFEGISDADLLAECEKRNLGTDFPDDDDDERCDRNVQARDVQFADVERLAEHIAGGETDEALEALSQMLPWHLPHPQAIKRRVAMRKAEPARRGA